jgi:hypothetical protein
LGKPKYGRYDRRLLRWGDKGAIYVSEESGIVGLSDSRSLAEGLSEHSVCDILRVSVVFYNLFFFMVNSFIFFLLDIKTHKKKEQMKSLLLFENV